jgi:uncharacterized membrane protein YGL010W
MENRWDTTRPLAFQIVAAGLIVAAGALLLPVLGLAVNVLARELGALIGEAVVAVVRGMLYALGVFIPGHGSVEMRLPSLMSSFTGRAVV